MRFMKPMKFRLAARVLSTSRILTAAFVLALALTLAPCARAATLRVTNTADSGPGSLRQTPAGAASGSTITFTNALSGQTILLTSGQITRSNIITVDASSAAFEGSEPEPELTHTYGFGIGTRGLLDEPDGLAVPRPRHAALRIHRHERAGVPDALLSPALAVNDDLKARP
jgi:hypothetical protein